jgi:hypothetical protein
MRNIRFSEDPPRNCVRDSLDEFFPLDTGDGFL